jgi:hypothetical protein
MAAVVKFGYKPNRLELHIKIALASDGIALVNRVRFIIKLYLLIRKCHRPGGNNPTGSQCASVRRLAYRFLVGLLTVLSVPVRAQDAFPTQTIRIVVPFSPGGTADVLARAIAARLQARYGSSVVVENRAGAGGNIGAEAVAKARPDGHTLVLGTIGIHAAYMIYKNMGYDPAKDLRPVIVLARRATGRRPT